MYNIYDVLNNIRYYYNNSKKNYFAWAVCCRKYI